MTSVSVAPSRAPRFRTIDGLRGIAAFGVALFHFNSAIVRSAPNWLPSWGQTIALKGYLGVEIFFVISGFVIAYSVRDGAYSFRYLGSFALRRSIRLDPPYWCTIAMECVLLYASVKLFPSLVRPLPGIAQTLSHLIYAQEILQYGSIVNVFWTLCFEIQFYLLFVTLLVLWQKQKDHLADRARKSVPVVVLAGLFAVSLYLRYPVRLLPIPGIALERWFQFFLGVLTYWVVSKRVAPWPLYAAYVAVIGTLIATRTEIVETLPVIVSVGVLLLGRRDMLDKVFSNRPFQFLGRISYSFYLIHSSIGWRWISLLQKLVGPSFGIAWGWIAFASACAICFIASDLMWRLIESPTMRFSKRIRLPVREAAAPGVEPSRDGAVLAPVFARDRADGVRSGAGVP